MQSKRTMTKWVKKGDFSKFHGISIHKSNPDTVPELDRTVGYKDIKNSQEIEIFGFSTNEIVIHFTTQNKILLESLLAELAKQSKNGELLYYCGNTFIFLTAQSPRWCMDIINSSFHPVDEETNKEINEIFVMLEKGKIPNPKHALKVKLQFLLTTYKLDEIVLSYTKKDERHLGLKRKMQAAEVQIEETFHKLCGYDDSVPKAKGIAGTNLEVLLMMVNRINVERNKAAQLQTEATLLRAQLAAANRTSVGYNRQSLYGENNPAGQFEQVRLARL